MEISENILKENGYDKVESLKHKLFKDIVCYDTYYKKRIDDKVGIKYFVECIERKVIFNNEFISQWTFKVQLKTKYGNVNFETVQWFDSNKNDNISSINDIEEYFELMFITNNKPYYLMYYKNN